MPEDESQVVPLLVFYTLFIAFWLILFIIVGKRILQKPQKGSWERIVGSVLILIALYYAYMIIEGFYRTSRL